MADGSTPTPPPPPPPQAPPPAHDAAGTYAPGPPPKKGLSPLAWVGIGCGVIVLIGIVVMIAGGLWVGSKVKDFGENPEMSTAKMIVRVNPELELVDSDDEAGTLTVRNLETGEVLTVDVSEVKDGRLRFRGEDGEEVTIGREENEEGEGAFTLRDREGNETFRIGAGGEENVPGWVPRYPGAPLSGTMTNRTGGELNGGFAFETTDPVDDVVAHFTAELSAAGMTETSNSDTRAGGGRLVNLGYEGGGRSVNAMITGDGDKTSGYVTYSEKGG